MSLVYSCVVPHTPLLLPTVGQDKLESLHKTQAALKVIAEDLKLLAPDTIIVLTPHGNTLPNALTVLLHSTFRADFSHFGDLATKASWKPDTFLSLRLREDFTQKNLPLVLGSEETLDYGSAVPLYLLTQKLKNVQVVPILTSNQDSKTLITLGKELKDEILSTPKRIAVIASLDLSHCASEASPDGFSPKGISFDEKIIEMLSKKNESGIVDIDAAWAEEAKSCSPTVLALFAGIIEDMKRDNQVLSYEHPFGVGYVVARMCMTLCVTPQLSQT